MTHIADVIAVVCAEMGVSMSLRHQAEARDHRVSGWSL